MKSMFTVLFLSAFSFAFGQSISDYSVVYVPQVFDDFKTENKYGLNALLVSKLKQKNFTVIETDQEQWPAELAANPCNVLTANVLNDSSILKNKLILEFTDCNGRKVLTSEAKSNIKDFTEGFQDALNKALVSVTPSSGKSPAANLASSIKESVALVKTTVAAPNETKKNKEISAEVKPGAEIYSNGAADFSKVNLAENHFIFTSSNSSVPYAVFRESGKKGIYHVTLQDGTFSLGYWDGNNLTVETPQKDSPAKKMDFTRK